MNFKTIEKLGLILTVLTIIFFFSYKFYNYVELKNKLEKIDYSILEKYSNIFYYKNGRYPNNTDEFNCFIKDANINLYNTLKEVNYISLKTNDHYDSFSGFYLKGFDNKNDSLKKSYFISNVNFLESLFIKGDLLFDRKTPTYEIKYNNVYEISGNSLKIKNKIVLDDFYDLYRKELKCDSIALKDNFIDNATCTLSINNKELKILNSTLSKESQRILLDDFFKVFSVNSDGSIYILKLLTFNIEDLECVEE